MKGCCEWREERGKAVDNLCVLLCTLSRVEGREAIAKLEEMTLIKKKLYKKKRKTPTSKTPAVYSAVQNRCFLACAR